MIAYDAPFSIASSAYAFPSKLIPDNAKNIYPFFSFRLSVCIKGFCWYNPYKVAMLIMMVLISQDFIVTNYKFTFFIIRILIFINLILITLFTFRSSIISILQYHHGSNRLPFLILGHLSILQLPYLHLPNKRFLCLHPCHSCTSLRICYYLHTNT